MLRCSSHKKCYDVFGGLWSNPWKSMESHGPLAQWKWMKMLGTESPNSFPVAGFIRRRHFPAPEPVPFASATPKLGPGRGDDGHKMPKNNKDLYIYIYICTYIYICIYIYIFIYIYYIDWQLQTNSAQTSSRGKSTQATQTDNLNAREELPDSKLSSWRKAPTIQVWIAEVRKSTRKMKRWSIYI